MYKKGEIVNVPHTISPLLLNSLPNKKLLDLVQIEINNIEHTTTY